MVMLCNLDLREGICMSRSARSLGRIGGAEGETLLERNGEREVALRICTFAFLLKDNINSF